MTKANRAAYFLLADLFQALTKPERSPSEHDPNPPRPIDRVNDPDLRQLERDAGTVLADSIVGLQGVGALLSQVADNGELNDCDTANVRLLVCETANAADAALEIRDELREIIKARGGDLSQPARARHVPELHTCQRA